MSALPMEQRVSRLEGAYEQVDRRLGAIETSISSLRSEMATSIASLRSDMEARFTGIDAKFTMLYGVIFGTWASTILAILLHH